MKDNKTGASSKRIRHIIALSGGKDSSALAVYLRGKIPNVEYVFCDTGEELKETYEFIAKIENYLNISVTKLRSIKNFKYYLDLYNGVLPDARTRWCTRMLKLKPFEVYIGDDPVIN
ncbi:MAG TPA: phosphoadenosine phosphosulfate reductase, partial [Desulfobulbaceae bacterium]|nr:phosphoadenosine phosphosulfate reductase [Desulfobulbaceae bacterium]